MDGKAAFIKEQIKKQYKSVRQFAMAVNMPYSTIAAALDKGDKGIDAMAYATVISICEHLDIDPIGFFPRQMKTEELTAQEKRLLSYFADLNTCGQSRVVEYMEDIRELKKYSEK